MMILTEGILKSKDRGQGSADQHWHETLVHKKNTWIYIESNSFEPFWCKQLISYNKIQEIACVKKCFSQQLL